MAGEWMILNSVAERDWDAWPEYPWYPYLFSADGVGLCSLDVQFRTEEECRKFLNEHVLGAKLVEE